jgi:hypothetical protein
MRNPDGSPIIPQVPVVASAQGEQRQFNDKVREILMTREGQMPNGSDMDKYVTRRDLASNPVDITLLYPVGSIYINASVSTNPATLFGFGTWVSFGSGRVLVGLDSGQTEFDTLGETGGAKTHTLTIPEMPSHNHSVDESNYTGGGNAIAVGASPSIYPANSGTNAAGGGLAHNNLQPYIVVYMWKRTA